MADIYKKLYAYLVGEIDGTVEMISRNYLEEGYARDRLLVETVNRLN